MDIGTFLLMQSPSARSSQEIFARGVEQAQAAETLGFRNVWLGEHHFSTYGYLSRPVQLATYIAAKTTRLRVGTAVIVVPLHHPLIIAEEIATLDVLSGGRLDVGFGRGYPDAISSRPIWRDGRSARSSAMSWPPRCRDAAGIPPRPSARWPPRQRAPNCWD